MTEYNLIELNGLPNIFRQLAFKVYPYRKIQIFLIVTSFVLAWLTTYLSENYTLDLSALPMLLIMVAIWNVFFLFLCNTFYPNQAYTDQGYVLSDYEMSSKFMKSYNLVFYVAGLLFNTVATLLLLIALFGNLFI